MRKLLLAASAVMALGACVSPLGGTLPLQPPPMSVAQDALSYVLLAGSGDLFEIRSSQLALQRSVSPELRAYAQTMVEQHPQLTQTLLASALQGGVVAPPPTLINRHANFLNMLSASGPDQFDLTYLRMMAVNHNESALLHTYYAQAGDNPSLRTAAAAAAPVVTAHLQHARALAMRLAP